MHHPKVRIEMLARLLNAHLYMRLEFLIRLSIAILLFGQASELCAQDSIEQDLSLISEFVESNCLDCHSTSDPEFDFDLEAFDFGVDQFSRKQFASGPWEKLIRRIGSGQMPPPKDSDVSDELRESVVGALTRVLDRRAQTHPRPGREGSIRRMTRTEYRNSIRDLLGLDVNVDELLPKDESSHGFDNITVEELSPALLNRYLTAAQKISRAYTGVLGSGPVGLTVRVPADRTQERHVAGLPFGTRGGTLFNFPVSNAGLYEIELKLTRDRDEKVEGLNRKHNIDILVDGKRVHQFTVKPPKGKGDYQRDFTHSDSHLRTKLKLEVGVHEIGVTFPKTFSSLVETKRQPFDANYNRHRHPRLTPAIYQVSMLGPFESEDLRADVETFAFGAGQTRESARKQFKVLLRRAYRRPIEEADMTMPMRFFDSEFQSSRDFRKSVEAALAAILINPNFLLRIEQQPADVAKGEPFSVSQFELASRLSYFIWSSLPDDELLDLAEAGKLDDIAVLKSQVKRMLADRRSKAMSENFASQWLYLRNLESITPDLRAFPDFDDNLRQAFRQETQRLISDVVTNDSSVLNLIRSDYTHLNERLARHYGIPKVLGSHFRRVNLDAGSRRGGLLRHGSILMVTSYATRTSPTIRGNWILENMLGTPAPPPPPNIPNLKENTMLDSASLRERLALHRANPACASCHDLVDPVGFSLENYDAVGRWRELDGEIPVDSDGSLPDGTEISNVEQLEAGIMERPEMFVRTMTEKLLTFALGRGVESDDGPAVRKIVRSVTEDDFKFSSIVTGIVLSEPFRMRSAE